MTQAEKQQLIAQLGEPLDTVTISWVQGMPNDQLAFWQPIYDRTLADCVYGSLKASLDATCYNRIAQNMQYIAYCLQQLGSQPHIFTDAFATRQAYFHLHMWNKLKQSILNCGTFYNKILQLSVFGLSTPCELVDYQQVNKVEEMLWLLYQYLSNIKLHQYCVNDLFAGDYMYGGEG